MDMLTVLLINVTSAFKRHAVQATSEGEEEAGAVHVTPGKRMALLASTSIFYLDPFLTFFAFFWASSCALRFDRSLSVSACFLALPCMILP